MNEWNIENVPPNELNNKNTFFGPPMRAFWEYLRREFSGEILDF
jgi:hypothetical protein